MSETHYRPKSKNEKFAACRVIRASRALGNMEKLVWCETVVLDQGPAGAWISAEGMADRLGRGQDSIERARGRLQKLGLLRREYIEDDRTPSWFAVIPVGCLPASGNVKQAEIRQLADLLDLLCDETTRNSADSPTNETTRETAGSSVTRTPCEGAGIVQELSAKLRPDYPQKCGTTTRKGAVPYIETEETEETQSSIQSPQSKEGSLEPSVSYRPKTEKTEGANALEKTEASPANTAPNQRDAPPGYEWANERQLVSHTTGRILTPGDTLRVLAQSWGRAA